jgi:hypothetical protein
MEEGRAAERAAKFNAAQAEKNARQAQERAIEDERAFRLSFRREQASNVTSIAASGVKLEGSPLEVLQDNAAMAEQDALKIRKYGALQAEAFRSEAQGYRMGGSAARRAGNIGGAANLLTGAANTYEVGQKSGAWS